MSLSTLMQAVGYKRNYEGVCFGVAHCAKQAILLREEMDMAAVLMFGLRRDPALLQTQIALSRSQGTHQTNLEPFRKVDRLFWTIDQYQNQSDQSIQNDKLTESSIDGVLDGRLQALGGIVSRRFCGIYTRDELVQYFDSLEIILSQLDHPVAFVLESADHSISLALNPAEKQWIVFNESKTYITSEIADAVMKIFTCNTSSAFVAFGSHLYVSKANESSLTALLSTWQATPAWTDIHAVTQERAARVDVIGVSLLHLAAREGDEQTARKLLLAGANPKALTCQQQLPLMFALGSGNTELVKLFSQYVSLNEAVKNGIAPLHIAVAIRAHGMIEALLSHQATPDCIDDLGVTPFYYACASGDAESVRLLLRFHASPAILTHKQLSPFDAALSSQNQDIIEILLQNDIITAHNPILFCIKGQYDKSLTYLLSRCRDKVVPFPCTDSLLEQITSSDTPLEEGIQARKNVFLQSRPATITAYQIARIFGYDNIINCFVNAGLGPQAIKIKPVLLSHNYAYGRGKRVFFHALPATAPERGLDLSYAMDGRPITLTLLPPHSALQGDALKRHLLDAVKAHIDAIFTEEQGSAEDRLPAFEAAFKSSQAFELLKKSQGLVTSFRHCLGSSYKTDSVQALEAMFEQARGICVTKA